MRNRWNLALLAFIAALTAFSIFVVWPGWPQRYLPNFIDWPEGQGIKIGGFEREAMRLGLDLQGGSYVLLEGDVSRLPSGVSVDQAMDGVKNVIERRVNAFGVSETEISREGKNRLAVQLPGISPEEAKDLIGKTAQLEFRQPKLNESQQMLCQTADGQQFPISAADPSAFNIGTDPSGQVRTAQCFGDGQIGTPIWEPASGQVGNQARTLTGSFLKPTSTVEPVGAGGTCQNGPSCVTLNFNGDGAQIFQQITERLAPQRFPLAIFLDEELISAPRVNSAISGGSAVIEGLELGEAKQLAVQLNAGALPVPMRAIQESEVDATLGEGTLVKAVQAGIIGVLAVMAFMVLYYRLPGVLASMALVTYISTVMMIFKIGPIIGPVTITLAGIAGFVLSVGMAVDANILVFERTKEELRSGRNLASAIEHGFDRAWSSIRDSNVSTLITCLILWWFGDQLGASLVKGFALTLGIGVLVSMFSAIIVTRTYMRLLVGTPVAQKLGLFGVNLNQPAAAPSQEPSASQQQARGRRGVVLDFVKRRWLYFTISTLVLIPGIISLLVPPALKPGIEFTSGATFTARFENAAVSQEDVHRELAALGHDEARVQRTSEGAFLVRTSELKGPVGPPVGPQPPSERDTIVTGLTDKLGPVTVTNFSQVSEIISKEIGRNAALAVGAAAVAILLYISFAFHNVPNAYRYGIAAIVATLHDAVFVLGAFSIFGKLFGTEINTMFITGLLTVIGFSVHDTIVVFDRIRENALRHRDVALDEVVNVSLMETLARSINTSVTTLLTIIALLLISGGSVQSFLLVLLIGIIAGTYSSIFVASQILVAWEDGDFARLFRRFFPRRPVPAEAKGS